MIRKHLAHAPCCACAVLDKHRTKSNHHQTTRSLLSSDSSTAGSILFASERCATLKAEALLIRTPLDAVEFLRVCLALCRIHGRVFDAVLLARLTHAESHVEVVPARHARLYFTRHRASRVGSRQMPEAHIVPSKGSAAGPGGACVRRASVVNTCTPAVTVDLS